MWLGFESLKVVSMFIGVQLGLLLCMKGETLPYCNYSWGLRCKEMLLLSLTEIEEKSPYCLYDKSLVTVCSKPHTHIANAYTSVAMLTVLSSTN